MFKIKFKLLFPLLTLSSAVYILAVSFLGYISRRESLMAAKTNINNIAGKYSSILKTHLNEDICVARTLANTFVGYNLLPQKKRKTIYNDMLGNVLSENIHLSSVWTSWEAAIIDTALSKHYQRYVSEAFNQNGNPITRAEWLSGSADDENSVYEKVKKTAREIVSDPYYYSYAKITTDSTLQCRMAVPIMKNGSFLGLTGVDVPLKRFHRILEHLHPYENSFAFLVSNNGKFVSHEKENLIGSSVVEFFKGQTFADYNPFLSRVKDSIQIPFSSRIVNGESFSFFWTDEANSPYYISFVPMSIGKTTTPWSIGVLVPTKVILKESNKNSIASLILIAIGYVLLTVAVVYIANHISRPIASLVVMSEDIALGKPIAIKELKNHKRDEIGQMAKALEAITLRHQEITKFNKEVGKANYDAMFKQKGAADLLGASVLEMRSSLRTNQVVEELRLEQEEKRNWIINGYAKFSEILRRESVQGINDFAYSIIGNLTEYLEADQGGLFLVNSDEEDDVHIEMAASYAYGKEQMEKRRIELGENLVGTCIQNGEVIHMVDLPKGYISVESGLGKRRPNSLLIMPLKFNENIFGAVEIAAFQEFEDHHLEFVERVSSNIASAIFNMRMNMRTMKLLDEHNLNDMVERSKEDIIKQAQEESDAAKREHELASILGSIDHFYQLAEFDLEGKLYKANDKFLKLLNATNSDVEFKYKMTFEMGQENILSASFWKKLGSGESHSRMMQIQPEGYKDPVWIIQHFIPILDDMDLISRVLCVIADIRPFMHQFSAEHK